MFSRIVITGAAVLALAIGIVSSGDALAAKGGSGKGGAASSVPSSIALNEAAPHLGEQVTFTVTYANSVKNPGVAVRCYVKGVMMYAEAGSADHAFLLGGGASDWLRAGGPAFCTAELYYIVWNGNNQQEFVTLATTGFDAAG
jgi:hypothetical protein